MDEKALPAISTDGKIHTYSLRTARKIKQFDEKVRVLEEKIEAMEEQQEQQEQQQQFEGLESGISGGCRSSTARRVPFQNVVRRGRNVLKLRNGNPRLRLGSTQVSPLGHGDKKAPHMTAGIRCITRLHFQARVSTIASRGQN
jgi:TolA-binding protein